MRKETGKINDVFAQIPLIPALLPLPAPDGLLLLPRALHRGPPPPLPQAPAASRH